MFISFEGIEGCGKSTQAKRLVDRLKIAEIPVIQTMEPGGTRVGREIRRILLDARNHRLSALSELFLYAADRAQHVEQVVHPALKKGDWVVCDRFFDATTVYQGYARGQDISFIRTINEKACPGIRPHITFLIDCPVDIGLPRALKRNKMLHQEGQDRFERKEKAFHEAVRKGYLLLAEEDPQRFVVVDGTLTEQEVAGAIFDHVRPFMDSSMA